MKHMIIGAVCVVSGLVMTACGGAPEGGGSSGSDNAGAGVTGAEATAAATEAFTKDPCAPICQNSQDPYAVENCACCHRHLPHPTCYQ
jgi:hypothetical protein